MAETDTWDLGVDSPIQEKFKVGNGIANIGNNCYMNAIVQILAHSPLFRI